MKPSNHVALGTRAKNILGERENERQKIQRGREERKRKRHRVIDRKRIVENIRLVCLIYLTADFGVKKTNAKLTTIFKLREKSKTGFQSCPYTVTLTPICVNFLTYIL